MKETRQCPSCGGFCKKSGCERNDYLPAADYRQIDEQYANLLAIELECMLIDPDGNRASAEKTLAAYHAALASIDPGQPTFTWGPVDD